MDRRWVKVIAIACVAGGAIGFFSDSTFAQITPDGTLPVNSIVTPDGNASVITGGSVRGSNLFHSFQEFSVLTSGTAYFNNSADIQNILTRVTGRSVSNIDGLIKANGTANLFLINPNGIIFGPNASLNIGGSFLASTASAIKFADGTEFNARELQATPLLTVSVPIGLQFGANPGSVQVQQSSLQVQPGFSLALVGGDVRLDGGTLLAPGGRVELGSVAGAGTVGLNVDGNNLSLSFPDEVARADVSLTKESGVNVRVTNGGSIAINAQNLNIAGGSKLRAGIAAEMGSPDNQAGNIDINATGAIALSDPGSFISNAVLSNSRGKGGDVNITTGSLSVTNGAQIFTGILSSFGVGREDVGDVNINARDRVSFDGVGSNGNSSGAFSLVESGAVGQGGNINLTAKSLSVTNGAFLQASTFGQGNAGSVNINVRDTASFDGVGFDLTSSGAYSRVEEVGAVGQGGSINIAAGSLFITNGAIITTSTAGQGNPGSITINVRDTITLDGVGPFNPSLGFPQFSGVFSSVKDTGVGEGGSIRITAKSLFVTNGAIVVANTFGQGKGGNIQVNADSVYLAGVEAYGQSSGLFTPTEPKAIGQGGEITVNANVFRLADRAVVSSRTLNSSEGGSITINTRSFEAVNGGQAIAITRRGGKAGNITINATDSITISGYDPTFAERLARFGPEIVDNESPFSGLLANTSKDSTGTGGSLTVQTRQLLVRDRAQITVSSDGSGGAGNLSVKADSIRLNRGAITATTQTGNFGNINLQTQDLQLRRNSQINTSATGIGGNITINTQTIAALEDSDITANSVDSLGGRVIINTRGIFGTDFREAGGTPATSDITATSNLGREFSGTVEINTPDVNPTSSLLNLPENFVDVAGLIDRRCSTANPQRSTLISTGLGGKPPSPIEPLSSNSGWIDSRSSTASSTVTEPSIAPKSDRIIEAQGWIINAKGQVELVADAPTVTPYSSLSTPASCNGDSNAVEK